MSTPTGVLEPSEPRLADGVGERSARNRLRTLDALWLWWLPAVAVLLGAAVRLSEFAERRSLWLDELSVTENILGRTWTGLFEPLDNNQGAPIGWLLAEKVAVRLAGSGEYGLRLVSLVSGILVLLLTWDVARRLLPAVLVPLAVTSAAVAPFLIRYSNEVKQYQSDALMLLLLLDVALLLRSLPPGRFGRGSAAFWAVTGCIAAFSSHPANVVLPPMALLLLLDFRRRRSDPELRRLFVGCTVIGMAVLANYVFLLRKIGENDVLRDYWQDGMAPTPFSVGSFVSWLGRVAGNFVEAPLVLGPAVLVFALIGCGLVALFRRDAAAAGLVVIPTLALLLAASGGALPFAGRLVLGVVPSVLLLLCAAPLLASSVVLRVIGVLAVVVALVPAVAESRRSLALPVTSEDLRPVLQAAADRTREGDVYLVDDGAAPAFGYYAPRVGVSVRSVGVRPTAGRCDLAKTLADAGLSGRRVWFVTGHRLLRGYADVEKTRARLLAVGATPAEAFGSDRPPVLASASAYVLPEFQPGVARPGPCLDLSGDGR